MLSKGQLNEKTAPFTSLNVSYDEKKVIGTLIVLRKMPVIFLRNQGLSIALSIAHNVSANQKGYVQIL